MVFEVIGPVAKFVEAVRGAGFEWLGEDFAPATESIDDDGDEDSEYTEEEERNPTPLYVTMPTLAGLRKLLALWKLYSKGEQAPEGSKDWWPLFGYLMDLRVWSAKDRVDPRTGNYVARMLERHPQRPIRMELDLWYRGDPALRRDAELYVRALMETIDGSVLDFATIEAIQYQAALIELPVAQAMLLSELNGPLADADPVMRVRPQSFFDASPGEPPSVEVATNAPQLAENNRPPVVALLDGYPIANHALLRDRIRVHEVDVTGGDVPVDRRFHGTAMASLIVHGDLAVGEAPLDRSILSVPILAAPQGMADECTPPDKLPIAMVHRAVISLMEGVEGNAPGGSNVVIINHSVCDREAPFARRPSPWAKLLDYLAHKYRLLFVVSAGNTNEIFPIQPFTSCEEFKQATSEEREIALLTSMERAKGTRSILSPAESLNAITVGAVHMDGSTGCPSDCTDPFSALGFVNLGTTAGLGVNRAVKPDMVESGGRQLVRTTTRSGKVTAWASQHPDIGQLAAAPDPVGGDVTKTRRSTGTSNAAALTTRSAARLVDVLEDIFHESGEVWDEAGTRAVVLKALLTHSCSWGDAGKVLDAAYPGKWQRRREAITRFLGYGRPDQRRLITPHGSRITLLADDMISPEMRHEYAIPIPRAMIGSRDLRRITMTLAWSSPIDPQTQRYRGVIAELVDSDGKRKFWSGIKPALQPPATAGRRGTLQHLVLEDTRKLSMTTDGQFVVGVQARAALAAFANTEIPYAVAITLELAQSVREDVFADVAARVRTKVATSAPVPVRVRTR